MAQRRHAYALGAALAAQACSSAAEPAGFDENAPIVVETTPADGQTDVDPELEHIVATFSEAMSPGGWSWVTEVGLSAPSVTGFPYYVDEVTHVLPVKLEADTSYALWVNSPEDANLRKFQSDDGVAARAHRIHFRTAAE